MGKQKRIYDHTAQKDKSDRTFAMTYNGMMKSRAWKMLSPTAKNLYHYCRGEKNSQSYKCLLNHGKEFNTEYNMDYDFVFPAKHLEEYGILSNNARRYFKELEKYGFIDIKEKNKNMRKVNVYSFSDRWKKL